jgi:diguanylate cyclase (GGDEF)-like protein
VAVRATDFPRQLEAEFRASRVAALAELNASVTHFGLSAVMVLLFNLWDRFVDPAHANTALAIRLAAVAVILATGLVQRLSGRVSWAPWIGKARFSAAVLAVAGANAVVEQGYLVGLAGLVAAFLGGPYIVLDRRDYIPTTLLPLSGVALIMWLARLDRFAVINACAFLSLTLVVGFMLARVFEATHRRAFALEHALTREARTDALTGLQNRRSIEETAAAELKRQGRSGQPLALILCDVDHFKRINDEQGHNAGDRTIRAVGESLRSVMRATDALGRWGGEEFLALLPETNEEEAARLAERMRATVESAPMPGPLFVTVSLGVAAAAGGAGSPEVSAFEELLKAADDALYRAKAAGRNRVVGAGAAGGAAGAEAVQARQATALKNV